MADSGHDSDASSATEEADRRSLLRKRNRRRATAAKSLVAPASMLPYTDVVPGTLVLPRPELRSIRDFVEEHRTAGIERGPAFACEAAANYVTSAAAAASSAAASGRGRGLIDGSTVFTRDLVRDTDPLTIISEVQRRLKEEQNRQCRVNPHQTQILRSLLQQLPQPTYYADETSVSAIASSGAESESNASKRLEEALGRMQVQLPLMAASLESEQLYEAGSWTVSNGQQMDFPPCANGERCICNLVDFAAPDATSGPPRKRRFIMMAFMFEKEYKAFLSEDRQLSRPRPCIACCRNSIVQVMGQLRSIRVSAAASVAYATSAGANATPQGPGIDDRLKQRVQQLYYNKKDGDDGYFAEYMFIPQQIGDEPLLAPIVMFNLESVVLRWTDEGRCYLDQRKMLYRRPDSPRPMMGESVQHFYRGAGRH